MTDLAPLSARGLAEAIRAKRERIVLEWAMRHSEAILRLSTAACFGAATRPAPRSASGTPRTAGRGSYRAAAKWTRSGSAVSLITSILTMLPSVIRSSGPGVCPLYASVLISCLGPSSAVIS